MVVCPCQPDMTPELVGKQLSAAYLWKLGCIRAKDGLTFPTFAQWYEDAYNSVSEEDILVYGMPITKCCDTAAVRAACITHYIRTQLCIPAVCSGG